METKFTFQAFWRSFVRQTFKGNPSTELHIGIYGANAQEAEPEVPLTSAMGHSSALTISNTKRSLGWSILLGMLATTSSFIPNTIQPGVRSRLALRAASEAVASSAYIHIPFCKQVG